MNRTTIVLAAALALLWPAGAGALCPPDDLGCRIDELGDGLRLEVSTLEREIGALQLENSTLRDEVERLGRMIDRVDAAVERQAGGNLPLVDALGERVGALSARVSDLEAAAGRAGGQPRPR